VLFISESDVATFILSALELGVKDYVIRPMISMETLKRMMRNLLQTHKLLATNERTLIGNDMY
jgi:PleD family two-component response regulator